MSETAGVPEWHAGHAECGPSEGKTLEAEGEVAVARLLMDSGDLAHAASHLGSAIAEDPRLPEVHQALAELAARAGGPEAALDLFVMENPYIGAVACRVHLAAACGRWGEALGLLTAVIEAQPDRPWSHVAWIEDPGLAAALPAGVLFQPAFRINARLGSPAGPAEAEAVAPFYRLVRAAVALRPGDVDLMMAASGLARRLGDVDDGVEWACQVYRRRPDHLAASMLGSALRAAGRPQEALKVLEKEASRKGADLYLVVELAEFHSSLGNHRDAVKWIERALAADPDHELAVPARHGIRYAQDGDVRHLVALADLARERPEWGYSLRLLAQKSEGQSWLWRVDIACEASTKFARRIVADTSTDRGAGVGFVLSALEAPSPVRLLRTLVPTITVSFDTVGLPDMREPLRPVDVRVWRYEGHDAVPAVDPPNPRSAELVRDTVTTTWPHLPGAFDQAIALSALDADELLAVLVHPPLPVDSWGQDVFAQFPDIWIRSVQAYACLGIAYYRGDEPWADSQRRKILLDLLSGPEDWVTEAAGFALVATAWTDPTVRVDVSAAIVERTITAVRAAQTRDVAIVDSLRRLVLACPSVPPEVTAWARDHLEQSEGGSAGATPEPKQRRKLFGKR